MNPIEEAAGAATSGEGGLRPLEQVEHCAPVLGTPAWVTAAGVLYVAGNMVTDLIGQESRVDGQGQDLTGKSGAELLDIRRSGMRA
ncbi:hypothetical protein HQ32_00933 [Prauserella sp. Am3]|nr:hypothetical protein HQ32_00933 [Prauserella sp. Am3]